MKYIYSYFELTLFTSSWSPSMKQSLTSVLIADTSSFLDTGVNLENCEKVGSAWGLHTSPFYRKRFSELHHQINLAQLLFFHKRIFYFPIDIGRKKERMWKNGKESAETPWCFPPCVYGKGVRYISLTIWNSEFCLILCPFM